MYNTIVIGATGLVGSHLLVQLVKDNCSVIAVKRKNSNLQLVEQLFVHYNVPLDVFNNKITWIDADVNDYESLTEIFNENSQVYHCAAQVSFQPNHRESMMFTNVQGTANVVNACLSKAVNKLCYVSSVATLSANKGETVINENSFWKNTGTESAYGQSKYLAEMEVWRGMEEGLNAVMVNPSVIVGPHNFTLGSSKMIDTAAKGIKFYTLGKTGFVDVNDVAKALILLMKSEISAERFLLNSENVFYKDFFSLVAKLLNQKPPFIHATPWLSSLAWRFEKLKSLFTNQEPLITKETAEAANELKFYDASKFETQFNFKFNSIENTLKNTCSFYDKQHHINQSLN